MILIDSNYKPLLLRDFGSSSLLTNNPNTLLATASLSASVQFRRGSAVLGQVLYSLCSNTLAFDAPGGCKWRSALNDDSQIKMQLNSTGLSVFAITAGAATVQGPLALRNSSGAGHLNLSDDGDGAAKIDNSGNSFLTIDSAVRTSLGNVLHILQGGNVGIGTTTPAAKLSVGEILNYGNTTADLIHVSPTLSGGNPANPTGLGGLLWYYGAYNLIRLNPVMDNPQSSARAHLEFWTHDGTNFAERMRLAYDGSVGIGTTSPTSLLHVAGNVAVAQDAPAYINFGSSGNAYEPPTLTARSKGTKLVLYNSVSSTFLDYAIGIDQGVLWFSVSQISNSFIWYAANQTGPTVTPLMRLTGGSLVLGSAALPTTATDGFLYIPTTEGAPTGTPTAYSGTVPMVYDTMSDKFYIHSKGKWRKVLLSENG